MMESAGRRLISRGFYAEVCPEKFTYRPAIIKPIFRLRICHIEPLFQEVDPQHMLKANQRTISLARGAMKFDQAIRRPPWDYGFHLAQKAFTPRLLMVALKTYAGESHSTHENGENKLNQIRSNLPGSGD